MSDPREKNAELVRYVAAHADLDGLDRFMSQFARAAVCEWLVEQMPPAARREFLQQLVAQYAGAPGDGVH